MSGAEIYSRLLKQGWSEEEIKRRVSAKKAQFGGFMSQEGVLFLIAKEEGLTTDEESRVLENNLSNPQTEIDLTDFRTTISNAYEGMNNIVLEGKISRLYSIHEFSRKDGTLGKVGSFFLRDNTGEIKIVLWDEKATILSSTIIEEGIIVRILGDYIKSGRDDQLEVHISKKGEIILDPKNVDMRNIPDETVHPIGDYISIEHINLSMKKINLKAEITAIYQVRQFTRKSDQIGFVRNIQLSDDENTIQMTFWDNDVQICDEFSIGQVVEFFDIIVGKNDYYDSVSLTYNRFSSHNIISEGRSASYSDSKNGTSTIRDLRQINGYFNGTVRGYVLEIEGIKEITKKDTGEILFLLKFIIGDNQNSAIRINVWGEKSLQLAKALTEGASLEIKNLLVKRNNYTQEIEATVIKTSQILFL